MLTNLPFLPKLSELYCYHNKLNELPYSITLTKLWCNSNNLNKLPNYPNLTQLYCDYILKNTLSNNLRNILYKDETIINNFNYNYYSSLIVGC